jgi:multidrug efflux pump subunit AcrA (membrane-fusion protein)
MLTATNASWATRISAIVVALGSCAALAQQDSAMPPPLAAFLESLPQPPRQMTPATGKALNVAIAALNAERYDEARAALGVLKVQQLSPFDRSNTEHILYRIARADGEYAEARQHILNAIDSGGLNEQELANARDRLEEIDATIATAPPT